LAAIGICPLAAISGYPETASFVTERDYGSWRGHAGNRLVRSSLAAVRIGAGSDVVLACVSSFTGFAEIRLLSVDPGQAGAIVRIITQFFCPFDRW
jgi:hypothetical protein